MATLKKYPFPREKEKKVAQSKGHFDKKKLVETSPRQPPTAGITCIIPHTVVFRRTEHRIECSAYAHSAEAIETRFSSH